jgi:hypothetical protein
MRRKYVAIALLLATVLAFLAVLFIVSALQNMAMSPDGAAALTNAQRADANFFGIGAVVCALSALVCDLIAWIGALLAAAKQNKWAWFICILLFNWFAILVYLLIPDQTTYLYRRPENERYQHSRLTEQVKK